MSAPHRPTPARDALAKALAAHDALVEGLEAHAARRVATVAAESDDARHVLVATLRALGYTIHAPGVLCPPPAPRMPHAARLDDPTTSHVAAPALPQQGSEALYVLQRLARQLAGGLTADEVSEIAGLPVWRRLSDLERLGLVEPVTVDGKRLTRRGRSGRQQTARQITDKGRAYLQEIRDRT